jgi:hypothetical protein
VGTDLWADEQTEVGPDQPYFPCPSAFLVGTRKIFGSPTPHSKFLPGMLSKVGTGSWNSWRDNNFTPDPALCVPPMELLVQAEIRTQNFSTKCKILVDTGCRIPLLFRTGLIPNSLLVKAKYPIKIMTADNSPMCGGDLGCFLDILLPIIPKHHSQPPHIQNFLGTWSYESGIRGSDVI